MQGWYMGGSLMRVCVLFVYVFLNTLLLSVGSLNIWLQKSLVGTLVSNWKLGWTSIAFVFCLSLSILKISSSTSGKVAILYTGFGEERTGDAQECLTLASVSYTPCCEVFIIIIYLVVPFFCGVGAQRKYFSQQQFVLNLMSGALALC